MSERISITRRGLPDNYKGDDPDFCNAPTKSGKPCRAAALKSGRCKGHGGTGPVKVKLRNKGESLMRYVAQEVERLNGLLEKHPEHVRTHRARVRLHTGAREEIPSNQAKHEPPFQLTHSAGDRP